MVGNICYSLGGYKSGHHNQALYASIDDLFDNAVPAQNQINIAITAQSAWKTLSNTPTYQPYAAVLTAIFSPQEAEEYLMEEFSKRISTYTLPPPLPGCILVIYLKSYRILPQLLFYHQQRF